MNDAERAELWKRLRLEEADLLEQLSLYDGPQTGSELSLQLSTVRLKIARMKEAAEIRAQLAGCENVCDAATRKEAT